jgi:hypothetical protein
MIKQNCFYYGAFLLGIEAFRMPMFKCSVCGHKLRCEFEVSCTGDVKRNVEKAPCCCGKPMNEALDD